QRSFFNRQLKNNKINCDKHKQEINEINVMEKLFKTSINRILKLEKKVEYLIDDNQDSEELYKKVFTSLQLEVQELKIENQKLNVYYNSFIKIYEALKKDTDERMAKNIIQIFNEHGFGNVAEDNEDN
ncbi:19196_t:CDS:2, partial [Gigaspora rosea]